MEFDSPENTNHPISDAERIAAETRKKTLRPMNPFIKPEDMPDPIAVNTPQANVEQDTENTAEASSLLQPSTATQSTMIISSKPRANRGVIITVVSIIFLVGIALAILLIKTQ